MFNRLAKGGIPLFFMVALMLQNNAGYGQKVQLIWSPSEHPDISHYGIYKSTHIDSTFSLLNTVTHPDTTYIDENVQNLHYYYAVTAFDIYGDESDFSNIVDIDLTSTPVELTGFSIQLNGNDATLEWITSSESHNFGFEIQRSKNYPSQFETIKFIEGNGTSSSSHTYQYIDDKLSKGIYFYRLKQIDFSGEFNYTEIIQISVNLQHIFKLCQNTPNPFNPTTTIIYSIPKSGHVELNIYNITGQLIKKLVNEIKNTGEYKVTWDGTNSEGVKVPSGIYFYQIRAMNQSKYRRMLLLK